MAFSGCAFLGATLFLLSSCQHDLPAQVTIIPTYIFFKSWGGSTRSAADHPRLVGGGAFNLFLMRQFFTSIPAELVDAARIDGSSHLGIWWRIMMPLSKPALTAITVFTIQGTWNDFFGPLLYLNSKDKMTLALALQVFNTIAGSAAANAAYQQIGLYTALMAASTVVTIPMIILFISAQRYFVEGIQMTGLKG
jgi:multiple sugar transport system permease protein